METNFFHIVICDDEMQICDLLQKKLLKYAMKRQIEIKTVLFDKPGEMIHQLPPRVDIVFLDMEMPDMDGLTAAARIRESYPAANIIFLSGHKEYVFASFRVKAFRYLLKPLQDEDLIEAMDSLCALRGPENRLEYSFQDEHFSIPYQDILYLEGMHGKIWIHVSGGQTCRWRGALASIAKELQDKGFFLIHRSFAINMHHIVSYNSKEIELEEGVKVPVSKYRLDEFKKEYIKLWGATL